MTTTPRPDAALTPGQPYKTPCELPTPHEREILTILIEEAAEVQQRATKLLRFGADEVQPGQQLSNSQRLAMEIGDFLLMVERAKKADLVDECDIAAGMTRKRAQLAKFMQTELSAQRERATPAKEVACGLTDGCPTRNMCALEAKCIGVKIIAGPLAHLTTPSPSIPAEEGAPLAAAAEKAMAETGKTIGIPECPTTPSPSTGDKGAPWDADQVANDIAVEIDWHHCAAPGAVDLNEATNLIREALKAAHAQGYTEGQKDRLPEEMPEWFPVAVYSQDGTLVDLWKAIRSKLAGGGV